VEVASRRQALEDRKVIERAKGIFMKQADLDENTAFRKLQKLVRNKSKKFADVAEIIVFAAEAIQAMDDD